MADHRFADFHCSAITNDPNRVIAVANEKTARGKITQYVGHELSNGTISALAAPATPGNPPKGAGPAIEGTHNSNVQKIGEKLVRDCRAALNLKP